MDTKRLTLGRDALVDLTADELGAVAGVARPDNVRLNCAGGTPDLDHTAARCLAGCTCYCS